MQDSILEVINNYLSRIKEDELHRYISWDNCYSSFNTIPQKDYLSLELAFYLASWGMYRGSSGLLQKNHLIHNGAVDILLKKEYQCLRCNQSNEISISETDIILNLKDELSNYYKGFTYKKLGKKLSISPTDTLISKIILGTLGCIPAYDRYFLAGLKLNNFKHFQFNQSSLFEIFNFLEKNISTFGVMDICGGQSLVMN